MKLFQNFFSPKWKSKNPEIRKQALIALNRDDNQAIFSEIISNDELSELRQLAVKRLNHLDELLAVSNNNSDPKVRELAGKISGRILAGTHDPEHGEQIDESDRIKKIDQIDEQKCLEYIAKKGDSAAVRLAAINKVSRESLLGDLAIKDPDPEIRIHVAEKLHQKSTLERVLKAIKNRDKQSRQIIKAKLEQLIAEEQKPKKILAQQKSLCVNMEQLGNKGLWQRDKIQFDRLIRQWEALEQSLNTDLQSRFDSASTQFQEKYKQYLKRNETRLKEEALLLPIKQEKQKQLEQLLELSNKILSNNKTEDAYQQMKEAEQHWKSTPQLPADIEQDFDSQFKEKINQIKSYLNNLEQKNRTANTLTTLNNEAKNLLSQNYKLTPTKISRLEKKLNEISSGTGDLHQLKSDTKTLIDNAKSVLEKNKIKADEITLSSINLLGTLEYALSKGEIGKANDAQKKIQTDIKQLEQFSYYQPDHDNLADLKNQLSDLSSQLFELNKWRSWASTPQKERLINEIEALIDSDIDPKEIAFMVSKARKDWQQLGPPERSSSQELWKRFNDACDKAYEPCKAMFDNESKIRHENYEKRIAFLNDLEAFLKNANWQDVNWNKVENLYQQSRVEWQNMGVIDKNKRKPVDTRFNTVQNTLKKQLISEWAKNQKNKENIISEAKALVEIDNLEHAIISVKGLQSQWKNAGRVQHHVDKKLWAEFRQYCDKIFSRRDLAKQEKLSAEQQTSKQIQNLCAELESLCNAPTKDSTKNRSHIFELKNQISELRSVNQKPNKKINERVDQAIHTFNLKEDTSKRIDKINTLSILRSNVEFLQNLESNLETSQSIDWGAASTEYEQLKSALSTHWKSDISTRYDILKTSASKKLLAEQATHNLLAKQVATIQLEIIAEIDSPETCSAERLKIQAERLSDRLKNQNEENRWQAFINTEARWLLAGALPSSALESFKDRHNAVITKLKTEFTEELENY